MAGRPLTAAGCHSHPSPWHGTRDQSWRAPHRTCCRRSGPARRAKSPSVASVTRCSCTYLLCWKLQHDVVHAEHEAVTSLTARLGGIAGFGWMAATEMAMDSSAARIVLLGGRTAPASQLSR